jgi:hypothetical protein
MTKHVFLGLVLVASVTSPAFAGDAPKWPAIVTAVTASATSVVEVKGNLSTGKIIALPWAAKSSVACFPATEFDNFKGNHVFYGLQLPKDSVMTITAVPDDPTTDVNLYALQLGATNFSHVPPNVPSATTCNASYDQKTDSNPGVTEKLTLNATTNPYNVIVGVAGPKGVVGGGFTLKVELKTKAAVTSAVLVPTPLEGKPNGSVSANGKLEAGGKIDLAFASKSSVACWPATEDVNFNGNHVLYKTTLPPYTDMTITATPGDPKTDVSVYAYMVSATDTTSIPPNVTSATSCEAGYDQKTDSNPGKAESVKLNSLKNPYTVYIGVAGANGTTAGAFDLKIDLKAKQ